MKKNIKKISVTVINYKKNDEDISCIPCPFGIKDQWDCEILMVGICDDCKHLIAHDEVKEIVCCDRQIS